MTVSRRNFVGGIAAALGYLGVGPEVDLFAQTQGAAGAAPRPRRTDGRLRLVRQAREQRKQLRPARVGDEGDEQRLEVLQPLRLSRTATSCRRSPSITASSPRTSCSTAGSGEALDVIGTTFLTNGKKVLGVEPSYSSVYQHATSIKSTAIKLPLGKDYRQDIPAMIKAANDRASEIGLIYLCNPNNPTGLIVTKQEVKQLLDGIPKDMPVLIDEAYHHFVDDPNYATSVPYVLEGRPVIIARTFSKIAALAGMRLGYAIATPEIMAKMRPYSMGSINALVKHGGAPRSRTPRRRPT